MPGWGSGGAGDLMLYSYSHFRRLFKEGSLLCPSPLWGPEAHYLVQSRWVEAGVCRLSET